MKKTILLLFVSVLFLAGCNKEEAKYAEKSKSQESSTREITIVKIDKEAAALGFPEKFISKEKDDIDWAEAYSDKVAGMDVEVYDTGTVVEVCGGLGCDK